MAFLVLDGVTIPVFDGSPRSSHRTVGGVNRSLRGRAVNQQRGHRRSWSFRAAFIQRQHGYSVAEAFERHVGGEGHVITLEHGLTASTGLNPLPGYRLAGWDATAGPDGVPGRFYFEAGISILQYDANLRPGHWSVVIYERFGASWSSAVYLGDGTGWLNGVKVGGGWFGGSWFSRIGPDVRDGVLTLIGNTDDVYFGGLVILPYKVSDEQALAWSTAPSGSEVFGPLPSMRMTGTLFGDAHTYVVGEVTGIEYVQKTTQLVGAFSSAWTNNAKIVEFDLYEVPRTFVRGDLL